MARTKKMYAATAVIAALTLSACGMGGNDTGSTNPQEAADLSAAIAAVSDEDLQDASITLARFFGDCNETTQGVTDIAQAGTECEAIQILTNKFEAENQWGITVERLGGSTWHSYYDGLNAALASSERPDVAVIHGSNLPDYADRGLLLNLGGDIGQALNLDLSDATGPATDAVTYGDGQYALPFDIHAIVSHLNIDLLEEAGLTNADGTYTMPTSVEEFLADAAAFKEATGKTFIDVAMANDPMGSRLWMSLVWQQGSEFLDAQARTAHADSDEAVTALEFMNTLVEEGYTARSNDYDASQQAFLRGEAGIMYNGVWAVNQYSAEAAFEYQVTDAPMLFDEKYSWANSHAWAVPVQGDGDPVQYRAAIEFVKFLYEHTGEWAVATGHMPSRTSAVESDAYQQAPHRDQYLATALEYAKVQPRLVEWPAIGDLVQEKIEATWLNNVEVSTALKELQVGIESALK